MNHATMMTVMEMGRIDFMVRSGFFKLARKNNWFVPSKGISAQFLHPQKLFQKANLITRVFHVDERFIYTEQKITWHYKDIAICIVKSTVKKGKENIPIRNIASMLGISKLPAEREKVVEAVKQKTDYFTNDYVNKIIRKSYSIAHDIARYTPLSRP